jgi:uncharacterized membrane protein YeaQ/YmgE (transglycosylase-associated protein family)
MPELMVSIISGLIAGAWVAMQIVSMTVLGGEIAVPLGLDGAFVAVMAYYGFTGYKSFQTNQEIKKKKALGPQNE